MSFKNQQGKEQKREIRIGKLLQNFVEWKKALSKQDSDKEKVFNLAKKTFPNIGLEIEPGIIAMPWEDIDEVVENGLKWVDFWNKKSEYYKPSSIMIIKE